MPTRTIAIDGREWKIFPSGYVTPYEHDEFGIIFVSGHGANRELRVTRYSPTGTRSREQSLAELADDEVRRLFQQSQPSFTSPEVGYTR
jgi:hypothetical protein